MNLDFYERSEHLPSSIIDYFVTQIILSPAENAEMTEIKPSQMAGVLYGSPKGEKLNENLIQNLTKTRKTLFDV